MLKKTLSQRFIFFYVQVKESKLEFDICMKFANSLNQQRALTPRGDKIFQLFSFDFRIL